MSNEVHVIFCGKLPSMVAFGAAIGSLGHPISMADLDGSLEDRHGYMPIRLFDQESGVEFDAFDGREDIGELELEFDPRFDRIASFRWGGSMDEGFLCYCGAAALAPLTGGVIYDEFEGRIVSVEEAMATAKSFLTERKADSA